MMMMILTPLIRSILLLLLLLTGIPFTVSNVPQISLPLVDTFPNFPYPWVPINYYELAYNQSLFIFSLNSTGSYTPLFWWDDTYTNFPQRTFGTPSYVTTGNGGSNHEAIAGIGLVLSGYLINLNMSCYTVVQSHTSDYVRDKDNSATATDCFNFEQSLLNYYDNEYQNYVFKDVPSGQATGEFWYQVWMSMLPLMVSYVGKDIRGTNNSPLDTYVRNATLNYLQVEYNLGGNIVNNTLPNFNWTGVNFTGNGHSEGYYNGRFTEPVAAGGIAFLTYLSRSAYFQNNDTLPESKALLQGAQWALSYLEQIPYDPYWEIILPYGAYIAARMNAELHTTYDTDKFLNWILQNNATPPYSPYRWGWGVVSDTWAGIDVHGLVGSNTDRDGYMFNMDTIVSVSACIPIVRYNSSYARALGKWAMNAANSARLFYSVYNSPSNQSDYEWISSISSPLASSIGYEGLRKWGFNESNNHGNPLNNLTGPYATGDAKWNRGSATNLAIYGSAYIGIFGRIIQLTNVTGIVTFDILPIDYYCTLAWPTLLIFNPYDEQDSKDLYVNIRLPTPLPVLPNVPFTIYDSVQQIIVSSNNVYTDVNNPTITLRNLLPSNTSSVLVFYPSSAVLSYDGTHHYLLADNRIIDYRSNGLPGSGSTAPIPRSSLPSCSPGGSWEGPCQWPSQPPSDCPFLPSTDLLGITFSGIYGSYPTSNADTWYPSLSSDGRLYTSFADGEVCVTIPPPSPPPVPQSFVALQWWWSESQVDNVLSTDAFPPDPKGGYEFVGTIGYAGTSAIINGTNTSSCELQLFRNSSGTQEYWTVCGSDEASAAISAGYILVASLNAYLPLASPSSINPNLFPPSVSTNMPPDETSGWVATNQLYSSSRGDHYATPEHFLPEGYTQQRQMGFMVIELSQQGACVTASGGNTGIQGVAILDGDDAFSLNITHVGSVPHPPFSANVSFPGELGFYPSTSFIYKGTWVFGYYLLADPDGIGCGNWCHLGPLVAFGIANTSSISGSHPPLTHERRIKESLIQPLSLNWSWAQSPYWGNSTQRNDSIPFPNGPISSVSSSSFGVFEPLDVTKPIRMGVPRFVDFGMDNQYSPDGKAYLIAKGCVANDGIHCSFMTGDSSYLARTVRPLSFFTNLSSLNDATNWEFYAGTTKREEENVHDTDGLDVGITPSWTSELGNAQPLFSWPSGIGGLTLTYNPPLQKYILVNNLPGDRIHPTNCSFDTAVLEADSVTGPYRLVSYMKSLGPQMYFQQFSSKFWSNDGLTGVLFSSGNWDGACVTQGSNPPGERYGMVTTELSFLKG